jgi:hypothetical protein
MKNNAIRGAKQSPSKSSRFFVSFSAMEKEKKRNNKASINHSPFRGEKALLAKTEGKKED